MQIGCCCDIEQASVAAAAGFDFLECRLTTLQAAEPAAPFVSVLESYQASPLPVAAFNVFLPGTIPIVGHSVDREQVRAYTGRALDRAAQIGARMLVLGSGRSRQVPDNFPRAQAVQQLVDFLRMAAAVAEQYEQTIAIEPLNRRESNILNSVAEAADLAAMVDRPQVKVLADFYHMDEEGEPLEQLLTYADWIVHIHVADSGRGAPGTGEYPYSRFVSLLQQSGYDGMVSVECRWQDFTAQAGPAARFLREQFG